MQFFGSTQFILFHIAEQESLDKLSVYLGEHLARESRGDIVFEQPLVFFESERLSRFLFERKPVLCKVVENTVCLFFAFTLPVAAWLLSASMNFCFKIFKSLEETSMSMPWR